MFHQERIELEGKDLVLLLNRIVNEVFNWGIITCELWVAVDLLAVIMVVPVCFCFFNC